MKHTQKAITPRQGLALLLMLAALLSMLVLPANAAGVPTVSSSTYYACYTLASSGKVYAYTNSSLTERTGGYIDCATDECRIIGFSENAVYVDYPVSHGRRAAYFPRSSFTEFDLTNSGFTNVTSSGKITTYRRSSGSATYGYIAKGDSVTILGSSGARTQVLYNVSAHYKLAWIETSQVSKYLTADDPSGSSLAEGTYTLTTALKSGMVLDVENNSSENGANIQIYTSNGTSAQIYQISAVGGGWYKIIHTGSGKAVDVSGGSSASGTNVWLYEDNGSDAQRWKFIPYSGGYLIQNKLGCYLDVSGGGSSDATNVWAYECNYTASQIWFLDKVSGPSPIFNDEQQISEKLNQMMSGAYGNGTYQVNTVYRGIYAHEQCKGFAKDIFDHLFGYNIGSTQSKPNNYQLSISTSKTRLVGTLTSLSSQSDAALSALLTQARPGDFLQVRRSHGGSHSMIVLSTSSSGITVYECNVDGANGIRTATYSWASFRSVNAAVGLYTAKDYSLHC